MTRIQAINNIKIQYLSVADKIYEVTSIDFCKLTIEATKTDLSIDDVSESEVFPVEEFGEFRVRLINCEDAKSYKYYRMEGQKKCKMRLMMQ